MTRVKTPELPISEHPTVKMAFETTAPTVPAPAAPDAPSASPGFFSARLAREWKTIAVMIQYYCQDHHASARAPCEECRQLLAYAKVRLERCQFGPEKPTCARCPVHCYQRVRREQVKVVMRYAGPRMLWRHPLLSLRHWLDGLSKRPSDRT